MREGLKKKHLGFRIFELRFMNYELRTDIIL